MTDASVPGALGTLLLSVVIGDDQPMSAAGLRQLLGVHGFEVVAVVADLESVIVAIDEHRPDLLVIEPSMSDAAVMLPAIASMVDHHATPILAFTADMSLASVQAVLESGCLGIVPRTASADDILRAAIAVASRQQHLHQRAVAVLVDGLQSADPVTESRALTPREMDVLALIAGGRTNAGIAEQLGISAATVKSHVENLLRKLEANDRAQAVSTAMRRSLLR